MKSKGDEVEIGVVMIVIGTVLLLDKLGVLSFYEVLRLWPLALIGLGISMLLDGRGRPTPPQGERT